MQYGIYINSDLRDANHRQYCLNFISTLFVQAHQIAAIYFQLESLLLFTNPKLISPWQQFYEQHQTPLFICSHAWQLQFTQEHDLPHYFTLAGLTTMAEFVTTCQRIIQL